MKYSIIIPIYNAEKTLQRCLDSLLPQLNSDIEVLLINDGSSDSSGNICKDYLQKSDCFKYYDQHNVGVAATRNKGLDFAVGDYLLFIDSDDYVDSKYMKTIDECIDLDSPDMLIFSVSFLNSNRKNTVMQYDDMILTGEDISKQRAQLGKKQMLHSLWNKVFCSSIIRDNEIRFYPDLKTGEDSIFVYHYLFFVKKLVTKSNILYYVDETSQDSLSRKERNDLSEQLILASKHTEETLAKVPLEKKQLKNYKKGLSRGYYRSAYSCFLEASKRTNDINKLNNELLRICIEYKDNRIKPIGIQAFVISLPVLLEWLHIIRLILYIKK